VRRHERELEISLSLDNDDFGIIEWIVDNHGWNYGLL
jgi:hypothetical protein